MKKIIYTLSIAATAALTNGCDRKPGTCDKKYDIYGQLLFKTDNQPLANTQLKAGTVKYAARRHDPIGEDNVVYFTTGADGSFYLSHLNGCDIGDLFFNYPESNMWDKPLTMIKLYGDYNLQKDQGIIYIDKK